MVNIVVALKLHVPSKTNLNIWQWASLTENRMELSIACLLYKLLGQVRHFRILKYFMSFEMCWFFWIEALVLERLHPPLKPRCSRLWRTVEWTILFKNFNSILWIVVDCQHIYWDRMSNCLQYVSHLRKTEG